MHDRQPHPTDIETLNDSELRALHSKHRVELGRHAVSDSIQNTTHEGWTIGKHVDTAKHSELSSAEIKLMEIDVEMLKRRLRELQSKDKKSIPERIADLVLGNPHYSREEIAAIKAMHGRDDSTIVLLKAFMRNTGVKLVAADKHIEPPMRRQ